MDQNETMREDQIFKSLSICWNHPPIVIGLPGYSLAFSLLVASQNSCTHICFVNSTGDSGFELRTIEKTLFLFLELLAEPF